MENNNKRVSKAFFSFNLYPDILFETYEPGEKIILLLRAHPFTQISWVIYSLMLVVLILVVNFVAPNFFDLGQIFMLNIFAIVFLASYIWINVLNWYFNVGIITTKRIIDIDFHAIIYKEVTVAYLYKIEDITVKSSGYFGSLLDFGTIFAQTAGSEANIEFANTPKTSEVVQIINKLSSRKHER